MLWESTSNVAGTARPVLVSLPHIPPTAPWISPDIYNRSKLESKFEVALQPRRSRLLPIFQNMG